MMKRTSSTLFLSLLAVAAIAGCDRSAGGDTEPSTYTRNGPENAPAAAPSRSGASDSGVRTTLSSAVPRDTLSPATPRDTLSDTMITGKIKAAILSDPGMAGADVSVSTDKGVVVMEGTVKSQEQLAVASAHAQRQDGVMRVDSHLSAQ